MSTFVITVNDIRKREEKQISENRFNELVEAELIIGVAAQIEEKIDLLFDNYLDYQKEILSLSLSNTVRNSFTDDHVELARPNLNRKLVNILTAAKLYVDQTCKELSSGYGKGSEIYTEWNDYRNEQHANSISYQFMEILRNYVQHRTLPINIAGFRREEDKNETPNQSRRTVIVKSEIQSLLEFDGFERKKDLIEKLKVNDKSKTITLGYHISEYIDCLCRVHEEFRRLSHDSIKSSEACIEAAREEGIEMFGSGKHGGLIAVQLDNNNQKHRFCRLNGRRMERRRMLSERNFCDGTLSTSYVHSLNRESDI